jgi:two-component system OmpR family sensor kinase
VTRLPVRLRVTLAFTAAMAALLAALGVFVHLRFEAQLDETIDQGLRSRAGEIEALAGRGGSGLRDVAGSALSESDDSFAELLTPDGRVIDATPQLGGRRVLPTDALGSASSGAVFVDLEFEPAVDDGPARLLASPISIGGRDAILVVGAALDDRADALDNLRAVLLVGGPVALLLAALVGYAAAGLALRPVEAMRRRAAAISADAPDERLPVAPADDELRRLGETLNAMLDRLEAAIERERTFVDDASHELRTPLAMHKTELELALRYSHDPGELRTAISSAIEEVDRLIRLAEDLLLVARSDKGRLALRPERLDLRGTLEAVRERFAARAEESGRALEVGAVESPDLDADRLRVEQALANLVENALRHGEGRVVLSAERRNGAVRLHVTDEGPGFPAGFAEHAFERFSRGDGARGRGGAGLGLGIVAAIADAHRGSAGAASRDPRGLDAWIELPFTPVSSPAGRTEANSREPLGGGR